jgi:glutathione S-transferase
MYVNMLAQPELMLRYNNQGVPGWEDRALRTGWPLAVRFVGKALDIRDGVEVEDEAVVWRELDFVGGLLGDGRQYLCGGRFSAADLTFAALSASVVVPPVYGVTLPQPDVLPRDIAEFIERVRAHPAGSFALTLFRERRRETVA